MCLYLSMRIQLIIFSVLHQSRSGKFIKFYHAIFLRKFPLQNIVTFFQSLHSISIISLLDFLNSRKKGKFLTWQELPPLWPQRTPVSGSTFRPSPERGQQQRPPVQSSGEREREREREILFWWIKGKYLHKKFMEDIEWFQDEWWTICMFVNC